MKAFILHNLEPAMNSAVSFAAGYNLHRAMTVPEDPGNILCGWLIVVTSFLLFLRQP